MSDTRIRLGTNPIAWSNDDLRTLGGATPLETCLAEAKQAGFEGIELGHKFPRTAPELNAVLDAHGLALVSGWYSAELLRRDARAEIAAIQPHLNLLRDCGANVLIFAETSNAIHGDQSIPLAKRPRLEAGDWRGFGARMTEVGKAVADAGLALVYHHHMGTVVESAEEIARLMDSTGDSVKLLLDTGHATFGGADPVALARTYRDRIGHVHTKDIRQPVMGRVWQDGLSFLDAVVEGVFTVPGDGMVDFRAVLSELPHYRGWLVIEAEQDPEKANPLHYATMGCRNLARFAREAGLPA
ncbi:myo-inosose-2 dehydratase [Muricoccus radiodurans]|uniref:myo-inosose-2 dehydratase n=1 Tax=Muricoccus radiodurans TaxID=2231721 RepID=UPI003CE6C974